MPNFKQERGFVHFLSVLAVGLFSFLLVASFIPVSRHYNDGKSNVAGVYLAKDDSSENSDSKDSEKSSSSGGDSGSHDSGSSGGNSSSGSSGGASGGSSRTTTSSNFPQTPPKPVKVETKEVENEVKDKGIEIKEVTKNSKVETKTTAEKLKSEIRQGNLRIKFEVENGKVKVETKVKQGENEVELESEAENEAVKETEAELEKADVKVATAPGQIALVNKRVGALLNFPISVDPTTKQLTVTTPAGSKIVAVLPQKAIDNMLAAHIMDDVLSEKVNNNLASVPELVKLEIKNGVLGYEVKGTKTHKLLGVIPIKTGVEAFISAENGQLVESTQSLLGRILSRIAP